MRADDLESHALALVMRMTLRGFGANVPIQRMAQMMGHDSYNATLIDIKGPAADLQSAVEKLAYE